MNLPTGKIADLATRAFDNDQFYESIDLFTADYDDQMEVYFGINRKISDEFEYLFKLFDREAVLDMYEEKYNSIKAERKAGQDAKNVEEGSSVQDEKSTCHRCGEDMGPDDDECHSCELEFAKKYNY